MKDESIYDVSKSAVSIMNTCITETAKGKRYRDIPILRGPSHCRCGYRSRL